MNYCYGNDTAATDYTISTATRRSRIETPQKQASREAANTRPTPLSETDRRVRRHVPIHTSTKYRGEVVH